MTRAERRSAWPSTWLSSFSVKLAQPQARYNDYGEILIAFPQWGPETLERLTVKKRKYWVQWSKAWREQMSDA